jgi:hypothetical protein
MSIPAWASAFTDNVTVVTASFLNWVRTNLPKAVDGVGGGTYTPSDTITINGAGLRSDNIHTSTVTGSLTVEGALDCETTLNVDGATTVAALTASGLVTTTSKLLLSGTGAGIRYRVNATEIADANATIDVDFDVYVVAVTPASVARTMTLRHSTSPVPAAGERIRVVNTRTHGIADIIFAREGGTELARIPATGAGTGFVEFVFDGTKWWASGCGGVGSITVHT